MATVLLSAVGMAVGGSVGGSVLGLSMATIGRAAGATLGRAIDARILGEGSDPVETGRVDRFRLMGASEGAAVTQIFGRARITGQVIWASQFQETGTTSGGGKGTGKRPSTTTFSYTVNMAVALCEGEITRIGRVWADGVEVQPETLNMRVYTGRSDQVADPKMEAIEGAGQVPAYRGIAYVLFEDLELGQFGNRVPQFTFEVMRPSSADESTDTSDIARQVKGVAIIPGAGEYGLATTPVYMSRNFGQQTSPNVNTPSGKTDFATSLEGLSEELPSCASALLVVSWFGSDLRCNVCEIQPKVEQADIDGDGMPWNVAGITRGSAAVLASTDGRPNYGGTPTDAAVIEAIGGMKERGISPVFYPFILMEQDNNNTLPDPWSGSSGQPAFSWRGRITLSVAPGRAGSPDQTATADAEVASFMGTAQVSDFAVTNGGISYHGTHASGYRRFILHYAHLCALAGGVGAFCIGSEMRGLTQIRGAAGNFPGVDALRALATDVRAILGAGCKISYAADWSEYHGYQPSGTGDKLFNLDPLWADPNIDFIGIDIYMPVSDWRDEEDHADASWGAIYDLDYLKSNIAGGEGHDWYYANAADRDAQVRSPITDGLGEPWIWRVKDLAGWWANPHHERVGGIRATTPSDWLQQSKPIWFTEFGCAAIDKATNQPNKFLDPKSSESSLPYFSNGQRDDYLQMQYLRAMYQHFADVSCNPVSAIYGEPMVDMAHAHVWAWDARPFPYFPGNTSLWSDGENYARGHWLNGRTSARTLASIVTEICVRSGLIDIDVSDLHGLAKGYVVSDVSSARAALQPLMVAYGIEASEQDGILVFWSRGEAPQVALAIDDLAIHPDHDTPVVRKRVPVNDIADRVQLGFIEADGDYEVSVVEAIHPESELLTVDRSEFPIVLDKNDATAIVTRWSHESRVAQEKLSFALPPSRSEVRVGQTLTITLDEQSCRYRVDRIEENGVRLVDATRMESQIYKSTAFKPEVARLKPVDVAAPVEILFMDLPLLTGDEAAHAPYLAASAQPWPGSIAIYGSGQDASYALQDIVNSRATIGLTMTNLDAGRVGLWNRHGGLEVRLVSGQLASASEASLFAGANTIAIGNGSEDGWEVIQFKDAVPIGDNTYRISGFLRGQAGSDCQQPSNWPMGSYVALLDGLPQQMNLPIAARGTQRHMRYGPAGGVLSDPSYRYTVRRFQGNGYRPYRVCHVCWDATSERLKWVRRTRIDGDLWGQTEVPLGEESEIYVVEVRVGGTVVRSEQSQVPNWDYTSAKQTADGVTGDVEFAIAQVSSRYGIGPFQTQIGTLL